MESKGRITGSLVLRGREFRIACIDGMDKSWGPRRDWGNKGASWVQVNLSDELSAFFVFSLAFREKEIVYESFKYGFLSDHGERRPILSARMSAKRSDMLVTRADIDFTDDRGIAYAARGTTIAAGPWYNFNPSSVAYQTLMRWDSEHGTGYSHIADFTGHAFLSAGMADRCYG